MRILVTFGSKLGGTAGIADTIALRLRAEGHDVDVIPAKERAHADNYGAVIIGGALYANRWHKDARRFVAKNRADLSVRPVWLFSSGPLDDSARESIIPPTRQVAAIMDQLAARGHATFGGRLEPDVKGFPAAAMAREGSGDWRDENQIGAWAEEIASSLRAVAAGPSPTRNI